MTNTVPAEDVIVRRWFGIRPWSRHSAVLLMAGLVYIFLGISYLYLPVTGARYQALVIARSWAPLDVWASLWIFVGMAALVSTRWPPTNDKWGYMLLTGLSSGWGAMYIMGVAVNFVNEVDAVGTPMSNISHGLVWWLVALMWWAISGLSNPEKIVVIESGPS